MSVTMCLNYYSFFVSQMIAVYLKKKKHFKDTVINVKLVSFNA